MTEEKIPRSIADDAAHKIALKYAGELSIRHHMPEDVVDRYVKAFRRARAKFEETMEIDETK